MAAGLGYKEFTTGDVLTAADANGYLASQVVMVFASAAARTSAIASPQEGMISYLKDTNATEYYSGSAWVALGASSSSFVGCFVYGTSNPSIANNTLTTISFGAELFDSDGFHSNTTNNSRITIPAGKAGKYLITGANIFLTNSTGIRSIRFYKNGSLIYFYNMEAATSANTIMNVSYLADLAVNDYVEMIAYQTSGGALTMTNDDQSGTFLAVTYQGA